MTRTPSTTAGSITYAMFDRGRECGLAWQAVEAHRAAVRFRRRAPLFVLLGSGEYGAAITAALEDFARSRLTVPAELCAPLQAWVDAYRDHPDYDCRRTLVTKATHEGVEDGPRG
jgi:hypothetical protein